MEDDKYTIVPQVGTLGDVLKVGDWIQLLPDGSILFINGPYCSWPKAEPRYFKVSIK